MEKLRTKVVWSILAGLDLQSTLTPDVQVAVEEKPEMQTNAQLVSAKDCLIQNIKKMNIAIHKTQEL